MVSHSSATEREHTPRTFNSITNNALNQTEISDALRRRAESVIHDKSIDAGSRAIIRYVLEINDPMLSELVERVEAGDSIVDNIVGAETLEDSSSEQKIEALTEIICRTGDDHGMRPAALLVLMVSVANADDPKALANAAKHCAFTRCAEMNLYGIVDTQVEMLERELFAHNSHLS